MSERFEPQPCLAVIELTVRYHPGALTHICGLLARRSFHVKSLICVPTETAGLSCVWLEVADPGRSGLLERQLGKLHDVLEVRRHGGESPEPSAGDASKSCSPRNDRPGPRRTVQSFLRVDR